MSIANFIIDMQMQERAKIISEDWNKLADTLCSFRDDLSVHGVPTIHIALIELHALNPAIGTLQTITQTLMDTNELTLSGNRNLGFGIPIKPNDLVATKKTYSAYTDAVVDFLHNRNVQTLTMGGVWEGETHHKACCVTSTALDYASNGFRVIIASEGTNACFNEKSTKWRLNFSQHSVEVMPIRDILSLVSTKQAGSSPK